MISGQLKLLNPVTGAYTNIGTVQPSYNAMGYNVADNYLYAMSTASAPVATSCASPMMNPFRISSCPPTFLRGVMSPATLTTPAT